MLFVPRGIDVYRPGRRFISFWLGPFLCKARQPGKTKRAHDAVKARTEPALKGNDEGPIFQHGDDLGFLVSSSKGFDCKSSRRLRGRFKTLSLSAGPAF